MSTDAHLEAYKREIARLKELLSTSERNLMNLLDRNEKLKEENDQLHTRIGQMEREWYSEWSSRR